MTKGTISVTIDGEVIEYHRAKGTKLSGTVNDYLKALMGTEVEKVDLNSKINELEADLAKAKLERQQSEQVLKTKVHLQLADEFKEDVLALRDLFYRKEGGSQFAKKRYFEEFQAAKQKYDISAARLVAMITGQREINYEASK